MERDNQIREFNHVFNLVERKNVSITGVKKIESFDSEEFLIDSNMGTIVLKGEGLELMKLDTREGVVTIKGMINSLTYIDENILKKTKENSVISRLFKWVYQFKFKLYFIPFYSVCIFPFYLTYFTKHYLQNI